MINRIQLAEICIFISTTGDVEKKMMYFYMYTPQNRIVATLHTVQSIKLCITSTHKTVDKKTNLKFQNLFINSLHRHGPIQQTRKS